MAYNKTLWKDQVVENPRTYSMRDNGDNTVTLLDAFGTVTELGTPVNAENMNHIENGISDVDNSAVHKAGTETITGAKIFTKNIGLTNDTVSYRAIYVDNSAVTKGTSPTSHTGAGLYFRDSTGSVIGDFTTWYNTSGVIRAAMRTHAPIANDTSNYAQVVIDNDISEARVKFDVGGSSTINANLTEVSNDYNDADFALKGWVSNPAKSTNVVHRSGNETINGTKTFSSKIYGSISGNAATVTNGVYTSGNQIIGGTKTFSTTPIVGTKGNSDNSTSAASTAYVKNILAALYPVGSIYIGTQNSCPLASLISGSTWQRVATSLVKDVSIPTSIAVYGNGKTLGLNDGSLNAGLFSSTNTTYGVEAITGLFNADKGAEPSGNWLASNKGLGVTTNTNGSSGLIAKSDSITYEKLTVNVWCRTA